jgi:hypothetical protein
VSSDLVLDLDDDAPDPGRDPVWWRAVRVPLWAVALLVLGVAVTTVVATRLWDAQQTRSIQQKVTILVHVPADNGLVGGGNGDGTTLRLGSVVQVINTGPLPIALGAVVSTSDGVALRGDGAGRSIPPGTAGEVIVRGSIDCRIWVPTEPIRMRLDVRGEDGVLRPTVKTVVTQGAWDELLATCEAGRG